MSNRQSSLVNTLAFLSIEEVLYHLTKEKNLGLTFKAQAATLLASECWTSNPTAGGQQIVYRVIFRKITDTFLARNLEDPGRTSIRASLVVEAISHNRVVDQKTRSLGIYVNQETAQANARADLRIIQCAKRMRLKPKIAKGQLKPV